MGVTTARMDDLFPVSVPLGRGLGIYSAGDLYSDCGATALDARSWFGRNCGTGWLSTSRTNTSCFEANRAKVVRDLAAREPSRSA